MAEADGNNQPIRPNQSDSDHHQQTGFKVQVNGWWRWVVVASSFLVSAVVDGVGFTVGVFFSSLQKEFGSNNQQTSWVSSVLNGTYLLIGPIVSACLNQLGIRRVASFGCVLSATAFCFATLSPTIEVLIVTYGLLAGIGLGFLYQPSVVIIGYYFVKRRGLALGITSCGSGIGAFAFAPLFSVVVDTYSWKAASYLAAALVLLCLCACATFRPIGSMANSAANRNSHRQKTPSARSLDSNIITESRTNPDAQTENKETSYLETSDRKNIPVQEVVTGAECKRLSAVGTTGTLESSSEAGISMRAVQISELGSDPFHSYQNRTGSILVLKKPSADKVLSVDLQNEFTGLQKARHSTDNLSMKKNLNSNDVSFVLRETSVTDYYDGNDLKRDHSSFSVVSNSKFRQYLHLWVWHPLTENFCLMKKPSILLFGIACFLMSLAMYVPTTFLPPVASHLGFESSKGAFLVSTIGIGNVIARPLGGVFSDRCPRCVLPVNIAALMVGGLATCLLPFLTTYPLILAYSFLFGACIGVVVALQVVVLIDLLGQDHLTNAFGLMNMYHGVGTFLGPPLAGFIWDSSGDVHYAFYVIGVLLTFAGVLCVPLPFMSVSGSYDVKKSIADFSITSAEQSFDGGGERQRGRENIRENISTKDDGERGKIKR